MDTPLEVIRDAVRRELSTLPPLPTDAAEKIAESIHARVEEVVRLRAEAALYDFLDNVPPFSAEQVTRITWALHRGVS